MIKSLLIIIFTAILVPTADAKELTRKHYVMGTVCEITAYGKNNKKLNKAITKAFSQILEVDISLSTYKDTSEVSEINDRADISPQYCSRLTFNAFKVSKKTWIETQGAFDITIEPLTQLWNSSHKGIWPTNQQLKKVTSITGMQFLELDHQNKSVWFQKKGMGVNFGGIGKGIAIDLAIKTLKKNGVKKGRINFGGQLSVFGPESEEEIIDISHPLDPNTIVTSIYISNASVATSSQRKNWNTKENHSNGHILDPRNGNPATFPGSVTVISPSATKADALSTALFVMGKDEGLNWVEKNPNSCVVYVIPLERDKASVVSSENCQDLNVVLGPEFETHF